MTSRARRRVLLAVLGACGGLLILGAFVAVIVSAQSSQASARTSLQVSRDFADYRRVTEERSARASVERQELVDQQRELTAQNAELSRQVEALAKLLEDAGVDVDEVVTGGTAAPPTSARPRSTAPAPRRPSPSTPSTGGQDTPQPSPSPRPVRPAAPPAPEPDPLLCLPIVGCLL